MYAYPSFVRFVLSKSRSLVGVLGYYVVKVLRFVTTLLRLKHRVVPWLLRGPDAELGEKRMCENVA